MPHQEGKLERQRKSFLIRNILDLIACIIFIVLLVWLTESGIFSLDWGIFFITYFIFLIALDFFWESNIIFIKKRWLYWMKTRDDADLFKKIKDPQEHRYWKNHYQKQITLTILGLIYFIFLGIWGFTVTQKLEVLLFIFVFIAIAIPCILFKYWEILWGKTDSNHLKR
jgi:hypothetical protein